MENDDHNLTKSHNITAGSIGLPSNNAWHMHLVLGMTGPRFRNKFRFQLAEDKENMASRRKEGENGGRGKRNEKR